MVNFDELEKTFQRFWRNLSQCFLTNNCNNDNKDNNKALCQYEILKSSQNGNIGEPSIDAFNLIMQIGFAPSAKPSYQCSSNSS